MSRSFAVDAIVLATYNVGEADRFCVLLTRQRGRIAARASAARKPGSRLGGALLPFQRIEAELREWRNGYVITGARRHRACICDVKLGRFLVASEITELLLMLVEEGEVAPALFDCVVEVFREQTTSSLSHTVRILHLLGHMPSTDMPHFSSFSAEEKCCIGEWIEGRHTSALPPKAENALSALCGRILSDHVGKERKVPRIKQLIMPAM